MDNQAITVDVIRSMLDWCRSQHISLACTSRDSGHWLVSLAGMSRQDLREACAHVRAQKMPALPNPEIMRAMCLAMARNRAKRARPPVDL